MLKISELKKEEIDIKDLPYFSVANPENTLNMLAPMVRIEIK